MAVCVISLICTEYPKGHPLVSGIPMRKSSVFKQGSAQRCHHLGNKRLFFVEKGYFYNALKRYEKGWGEVIGLSYLWTEMTRNSVLCCCCYIHVTVVAITYVWNIPFLFAPRMR